MRKKRDFILHAKQKEICKLFTFYLYKIYILREINNKKFLFPVLD